MAEPESAPAPSRPAPVIAPMPQHPAVDPPMVPFAVAGLLAWAVAGLVLMLFFRDWLARTGHTDWLWICLAGFAVGLVGLAVMLRHDAQRRHRRAGS